MGAISSDAGAGLIRKAMSGCWPVSAKVEIQGFSFCSVIELLLSLLILFIVIHTLFSL